MTKQSTAKSSKANTAKKEPGGLAAKPKRNHNMKDLCIQWDALHRKYGTNVTPEERTKTT